MQQSAQEQIIRQLFNEVFHPLVFSSFRYIGDYNQAKDIVQDVFVKVWQNFEKYKAMSNIKAYLHTAVKNSSLNYLRDIKQIENNKTTLDGVSIEDDDNNSIDKDALISKVHKAVDMLPENWREAFILSKYDKLKYYEIAQKMKISDKTVEKYISKALSVLRKELQHLISIISFFFINKL